MPPEAISKSDSSATSVLPKWVLKSAAVRASFAPFLIQKTIVPPEGMTAFRFVAGQSTALEFVRSSSGYRYFRL